MATTDETFVKNLEAKTGKSMREWIAICEGSGLKKHGELVSMLKTGHGFTHGYANYVAHKTLKTDAGSAEDSGSLIDEQYRGDKAALRPIYDDLLTRIQAFGNDITIDPKKTYVSLRRKKQFALIQPSTKTRLDIGVNLKGKPATDRLEPSGSFSAMCSHRIRIVDRSEVTKEVLDWLLEAYNQA